jgi:hypothetical protein
MGVRGKILVAAMAALAIPAWGSVAQASEAINFEELPLRRPSIPDVTDKITDLNTYWDDHSIAGQARFTFGLPDYKANRIVRNARDIQNFYQDLLYQQPGQNILRTRDLNNPFCDSLLDSPSPCAAAVVPVAPQPVIPRLPMAPPPVPALY